MCPEKVDNQALYRQLSQLDTEQRNPLSLHIDLADPREIVECMNFQDALVADCVATRKEQIALAIEKVSKAIEEGGRLIYCGAGTSGRIGVTDAAECPPTFGTDPSQVVGLIAGGPQAMFVARENVEDAPENGEKDIAALKVGARDVVCGLAASGRTPYVAGCLQKARSRGAYTVMVCCVAADKSESLPPADLLIDIPVGPEVIMGSTRLKSATAQKMVCNMITTGAMIRRGKVYENVMVDLMLTNRKLVERAKRIISMFTGLDYEQASWYLNEANGKVKVALFMALTGMDASLATKELERHDGFIRAALLEHERNRARSR